MSCFNPRCALIPLAGGRPIFVSGRFPAGKRGDYRVVYLPCGGCSACRRERRQDLTLLQQLEASEHIYNWFITLTYDSEKSWQLDEYIPDDGSLVKDHIRNFLSSVRHHLKYKYNFPFRYFGCGEYGDNYSRPHFHLNVFGPSPEQLGLPDDSSLYDRREALSNFGVFQKSSSPVFDSSGVPFWSSPLISKFWQFGNHRIYRATRETYQYVAGYVIKKMTGHESRNVYFDKIPEFQFQSRPSIGYHWWLNHYHTFQLIDNVHNSVVNSDIIFNGKTWRCPRIFDKWFLRQFQFDSKSVLDNYKQLLCSQFPDIPDFDLLRRKEIATRYKNQKIKRKEIL